MKTEFLKELGLTEEQIKAVFAENGKDIKGEQDKLEPMKTQIEDLTSQLTTAKDTLKSFDGVDVKELQGKITQLSTDLSAKETEYQTKLADMEFNAQLDGSIGLLGAKNAKAVRALLDLDSLKTSKNQAEDIKTALEGLKTDNDYLFTSNEPIKNPVKDTGNTNISDTSSSLRSAMGLPTQG